MEISLSNPVKKFDVSYSEQYPTSKEVKHMIVNAQCESDIFRLSYRQIWIYRIVYRIYKMELKCVLQSKKDEPRLTRLLILKYLPDRN